jgi:glycosyltransferase involved in cell wall biosynthesis
MDLLSIVVPVRNEAENVPPLFASLAEAVHVPCELIIVYDVDDDPTVAAARGAADLLPFPLRLIKNDLGRGPANALRAGFAAARGDAVVVVMADLSDEVTLIDRMVARLDAGDDLVCASRYAPGGQQIGGPLLKRALSRCAGLTLHLAGLPVHDATNSFRLYRTALLRSLTVESRQGFEISLELTVKAWRDGWRVAEVPARWSDRVAGQSKFRLWRWLPRYLHWYFYALRGGRSRSGTRHPTADNGRKGSP